MQHQHTTPPVSPRAILLIACCLALAGGAQVSAQAPRHTAQFLGPAQIVNDMNAAGDVVGWVLAPGVQAYVAGPSTPHTILPLPPGYQSAWAQGINDVGVIVGSAATGGFPEFGQAVSWTPDGSGGYQVQLLGQLPGHTQSVAYDVNNRGDIVGSSLTPGFQGGPSVWFNAPGGLLNISLLGAPSSPKEVNDEGVVVGISGGLFDLDTLSATPLPPFTGSLSSFQGWAINAAGELAGTGFHGSQRGAERWSIASGWTTVGLLFGQSAQVQAFDINADGVTVCELPTPSAHYPGIGTFSLASLLVPAQQGGWSFFLSLGEAINDRGQIAAIGTEAATGSTGLVLLTPVGCEATPTVSLRNAGSNPTSYAAGPALLGQTWTATVDLAGTTGHDQAWLFAFDSPVTIALSGGQTLLCADLGGQGELLTGSGLGPASGPIASFGLSIPADDALCGLSLSTQALHAFGAAPFALSNAQDLLLGAP